MNLGKLEIIEDTNIFQQLKMKNLYFKTRLYAIDEYHFIHFNKNSIKIIKNEIENSIADELLESNIDVNRPELRAIKINGYLFYYALVIIKNKRHITLKTKIA